MIILDATVKHARRNRDFGRIEALVELIVKQTGHPARRMMIRTNQPVHAQKPLRQRLTEDAALLAQRTKHRHHPISACAA